MCDDCLLYYLAAMIDGEGCITLSRKQDKRGKFNYAITVKVANKNQEMLAFLANEFRGKLYLYDSFKRSCSYVVWHGVAAQNILSKIKNKLKIKQPMAELALLLPVATGWVLYTDEEREKRELMFQQMKFLNQQDKVKCSFSEVI